MFRTRMHAPVQKLADIPPQWLQLGKDDILRCHRLQRFQENQGEFKRAVDISFFQNCHDYCIKEPLQENVWILGVANRSAGSQRDVRRVMEHIRPDILAMEVDEFTLETWRESQMILLNEQGGDLEKVATLSPEVLTGNGFLPMSIDTEEFGIAQWCQRFGALWQGSYVLALYIATKRGVDVKPVDIKPELKLRRSPIITCEGDLDKAWTVDTQFVEALFSIDFHDIHPYRLAQCQECLYLPPFAYAFRRSLRRIHRPIDHWSIYYLTEISIAAKMKKLQELNRRKKILFITGAEHVEGIRALWNVNIDDDVLFSSELMNLGHIKTYLDSSKMPEYLIHDMDL